MRSSERQIICFVSVLAMGNAFAIESFSPTAKEAAMCTAMVYEGMDRDSKSRMEPGIGWEHSHHWCDCVRFRYRALMAVGNKATVSHHLNEAIGGCDYVIRAAPAGSRILPRIHVDKGRALKLRGDTGAASQEFLRAITLDPREESAYIELSALQDQIGQRSLARETVVLGLQRNPESKILQKRYVELGGKDVIPGAEASPNANSPETGRPPPENSVTQESEPPRPVVTNEVEPRGSTFESAESKGSVQSIEVGSGQSCRFCPPEEIQQRWIESFKTHGQSRE